MYAYKIKIKFAGQEASECLVVAETPWQAETKCVSFAMKTKEDIETIYIGKETPVMI